MERAEILAENRGVRVPQACAETPEKSGEIARGEGLGRVQSEGLESARRNRCSARRVPRSLDLHSAPAAAQVLPSDLPSMEQRDQPKFTREPMDPIPDPWRAVGMTQPESMLASAIARGDFRRVSRRGFVGASIVGTVAGALGLASCASTPKQPKQSAAKELPRGAWLEPPAAKLAPPVAPPVVAAAEPRSDDKKPEESPKQPQQGQQRGKGVFNPVGEAALPWAKPRFLWAKGRPIVAQMNPMLPVTCVTVHHDGLEDLFWGTKAAEVCTRLERYRVGHLARGWADIGYHLAIDRGGTLWQGRAIRWQGAHVQFRNEGNIGILVMGNFDLQSPTVAQLVTLTRVLRELRTTYGIRRGRVYTHKEWPGAQTACPGRSLQPKVADIRKSIGA